MMDVDQPVSSTTDPNEQEEAAALEAESSSQENAIAKSPDGMIARESDELPALVISDSEEENELPPLTKAPTKELPAGEISGIAPIDTTVANVLQDDKGAVVEDVAGSETNGSETVQETSAVTGVVDEAVADPLIENIDLTGASSADDSGVSEESGNERTTKSSSTSTATVTTTTTSTICPPALTPKPPTKPSSMTTTTTTSSPPVLTPKPATKPSSEMTAQELLESLLGAQEEAFASHRALEMGAEPEMTEPAVEPNSSEDENKTDKVSDTEKIPNDNADSSSSLQQAGKDMADENDSKIDTVVIDDECLLEEMSNEPAESQHEMDVDEHPAGSSSSSCSGDGPNQISDDAEQANDEADEDVEKNDDDVDSEEPPRKKARSMELVVDEDSVIEASEPTFPGIEHDTAQNETRPDEPANKPEVMPDREEQPEPTTNVNMKEAEQKSTDDSHAPTPTLPDESCSSGLANDGPLKKQCIEVGGPQNVKPAELSVCPDVLVIDDDDDEDGAEVSCRNSSPPETEAKKQDVAEVSKLQADVISDNTTDRKEIDSNVPVTSEKKEPEPVPMEFLRKFSKPLSQMTRTDLEQLVLQKITEVIVHRSETAELRRIVKRQSAKLQSYERTIADMNSHYENLRLVAERAVLDMKKRAKSFIAPVKITRAVGLQVSRPTTDTLSAHKLSNLSKLLSNKRKCDSDVGIVTTTTNGVAENGGPISTKEISNHIAQAVSAGSPATAVVQFAGGHPQNTSANVNRHPFANSVSSPMNTTRFMPTNPVSNGIVRAAHPRVSRDPPGNVSIMPGGIMPGMMRLPANLTNDGSDAATPTTASLARTSPKTGPASAPNSGAAGGVDSPVRKFHKITPTRPPLSQYQKAQQEKQVRQQQDLLVQQIHEQSQQAQQRKAQISVRQDVLPAVESSSMARTPVPADASVNRQRPTPPNPGRLLNATNAQAPATQNYHLVSVGAIRPVASSTLTSSSTTSTTLQLLEVQKPNSQTAAMQVATAPAAAAASAPTPVNGSLIDLTDEDDTNTSSIYIKRAKSSHSGSFSPAPSIPNVQTAATNQLVRIQQRIDGGNGDTVVSSAVATSSSVGVNHYNNNNTIMRAQPNINRSNNASALQPVRHPIYNSNVQRLPGSTDVLKKRVVIKPMLAPLPNPGPQPSDPSWKLPPPQPLICVNNVETGIVISWSMPSLTKHHSNIETYQIYAYQDSSVQSALEEWRHVGDVKALLLPMAVTLTQFHEGQRYYFAVRAIDMHKRIGKFCEPRTWNDNNVAN